MKRLWTVCLFMYRFSTDYTNVIRCFSTTF